MHRALSFCVVTIRCFKTFDLCDMMGMKAMMVANAMVMVPIWAICCSYNIYICNEAHLSRPSCNYRKLTTTVTRHGSRVQNTYQCLPW